MKVVNTNNKSALIVNAESATANAVIKGLRKLGYEVYAVIDNKFITCPNSMALREEEGVHVMYAETESEKDWEDVVESYYTLKVLEDEEAVDFSLDLVVNVLNINDASSLKDVNQEVIYSATKSGLEQPIFIAKVFAGLLSNSDSASVFNIYPSHLVMEDSVLLYRSNSILNSAISAALNELTVQLSMQLEPSGVSVNSICTSGLSLDTFYNCHGTKSTTNHLATLVDFMTELHHDNADGDTGGVYCVSDIGQSGLVTSLQTTFANRGAVVE